MKITTLGTSHGDMTYCRYNSSTLLELECGASYLFDAGAPVDGQMTRLGKEFARVKAVFITHMHVDHTGGLDCLIKSLSRYPVEGQYATIFLPEPEAVAPFRAWITAQHATLKRIDKYSEVRSFEPGEFYRDENVAVTAIPTRHMPNVPGARTYAYLLTELATGKRLLYSGDLAADFSDFPDTGSEFIDVCLCEATHYQPESAMPILSRRNFGRLIFNHVHNPWHGEGEKTLLSLTSPLPYPVTVAHDLEEFDA